MTVPTRDSKNLDTKRLGAHLSRRFWNILLRTVHLAVMAILVGGIAFDAAPSALMPWGVATFGSGVLLMLVEAWPDAGRWLREGRGVMVVVKVCLLASIFRFWEQRLAIVLVAIVIASVGSHMPGRFRYWLIFGGDDR